MNGNGHSSKISITTSTGVSIGLVVVGIAGFLALMNNIGNNTTAIKEARTEFANQLKEVRTEFNNQNEKMDIRMKVQESNKNNWSFLEMYKWAVKLQQTNKDPKKLTTDGLLVPEPESITK